MSRITKEEVIATANELDSKGLKPSTPKIREILGKGSFSTIGRWLNEWEAPTIEEAEAPDAPESLIALMPTIWKTCYAEAERLLNGKLAEQEAQVNELHAELERAEAATDRTEAEIEQISAELDNIRAENTILREKAANEQTARERAETQRDEKEAHIESLRSAIATISTKPATQKTAGEAARGDKKTEDVTAPGEKAKNAATEATGGKKATEKRRGKTKPAITAELEKFGQRRIDA